MTEQQRFEVAMRRVLSVSPEELKRRTAILKRAKELSKAEVKSVGKNLNRA